MLFMKSAAHYCFVLCLTMLVVPRIVLMLLKRVVKLEKISTLKNISKNQIKVISKWQCLDQRIYLLEMGDLVFYKQKKYVL